MRVCQSDSVFGRSVISSNVSFGLTKPYGHIRFYLLCAWHGLKVDTSSTLIIQMSFKWEIMCLYDGVFRRTVTTDGCWCYSIAHNKDFHRRKACLSFHIYMVSIYSIQFGIRADFSETTIISHETPSCTLNVVMHNKYKATRRTTKSCAEHFMSALIFSSDSEQTVGSDCVNTICNERTAPATANRMDGNLCSRSPYLVAVAGGSFTTPVTTQL